MAENIPNDKVKIVVLTPTRRVLEALADNAYFPTSEGIIGVLPGHAHLMAKVGTGVLHYDHENMTAFLAISGGIADVKDNKVTLVVDAAEEGATIDVARAQKALERARRRLGDMTDPKLNLDRAAAAERRAMARIEAAGRQISAGK